MTKMAAMPIYGENLKSLLPQNHWPIVLYEAFDGQIPHILYINDDPGMTLTYVTARSDFVS